MLHWIRNSSRQFKPFIAHRVGEIHTATDSSQWRYVQSNLNAADLLTRGTAIAKLAENTAWWEKPDFIKDNQLAWPSQHQIKMTGSSEARCWSKASARCFLTFPQQQNTLAGLEPEHFSDWGNLARLKAWVYQFACNAGFETKHRRDRSAAMKHGSSDKCRPRRSGRSTKRLLSQRPLPTHSKMASLNPRLDEDFALRSQG